MSLAGRLGAALALVLVIAVSFAGYLAMPRETIAASYATSLEGRSFSQRHNVLMSIRKLDGTVIPPGGEFSFNRTVGSFSRDQGFRKAPVSYNGQLITDWGGGVCQASTTLYNAALLAGMKIIERNHHRFSPSYVPPGRDAAVAYSTVDLRFMNPYSFPVRIHGLIDGDKVRFDFLASHELPAHPEVVENVRKREDPATFYLGKPSRAARVSNTGRPGYEVVVYRITGRKREVVSADEYPAMNRVVQYRP